LHKFRVQLTIAETYDKSTGRTTNYLQNKIVDKNIAKAVERKMRAKFET